MRSSGAGLRTCSFHPVCSGRLGLHKRCRCTSESCGRVVDAGKRSGSVNTRVAGDELKFDPDAARLIPAVEGLDVPRERARLEGDLARRGWDAAAAHYRQAVDGVSTGNWEAANGQMRSLLEVVIPEVAAAIVG